MNIQRNQLAELIVSDGQPAITTIDNRSDFLYSGADTSYRISNFIGIGLKLKKKWEKKQKR